METLLLFSAAVFLIYIAYIGREYGVQKSISESYYDLPKKYRFVFTLVLWGFSIPIMIAASTFWMLLAGALICFVGAAPYFRKEGEEGLVKSGTEYAVHMVGAYGGVVLGLIGVVAFGADYIPLVLLSLLMAVGLWFQSSKPIWWIEVLAFGTIWLGTFLYTVV